jgi:hypothetical protein
MTCTRKFLNPAENRQWILEKLPQVERGTPPLTVTRNDLFSEARGEL